MTKNGLRGFSLGIFVACALVALYYYLFSNHSQAASAKTSKAPLSQSQVDQFLTKNGEIAVDKSTFTAWQNSQKKSQTSSPSKTSSVSTKKNQTQKTTTSSPSNSNTVTKLTLNITSNMDVWNVAQELEKDKIIKNKQTLYSYMLDHKIDKYLQLGTFTVSSNMSIPQIAKVITTTK